MPCSSDHSCQERNQFSQDTQACREPGFPTKGNSADQKWLWLDIKSFERARSLIFFLLPYEKLVILIWLQNKQKCDFHFPDLQGWSHVLLTGNVVFLTISNSPWGWRVKVSLATHSDLFVETLLPKHNSAWSGYIQEQQLTCMCSVNTAREDIHEGKLMKDATQRAPWPCRGLTPHSHIAPFNFRGPLRPES